MMNERRDGGREKGGTGRDREGRKGNQIAESENQTIRKKYSK